MTEHGLLNRILLIYREAARRNAAGQPFPGMQIRSSASIVRTLIHDHHEEMEEKYVFSALQGSPYKGETRVLLDQHHAGKVLTDRISLNVSQGRMTPEDATAVATDLTAFVDMYHPHEAREDTVIFPAWRERMTARQFAQTGEAILEDERRLLGRDPYRKALSIVEASEKALGIFDLTQYTPDVPIPEPTGPDPT